MADVRIDEDKRRLLITPSTPDEGSVLLRLPSRKWLPTKGMFVVPLTRANMKVLIENSAPGKRLRLQQKIIDYASRIATFSTGNRKFPDWFTFKTQPFINQREALHKIYRSDIGALFMRMGSGKSKVIIDLMTAHFYERRIEAAMVVCPLTVASVWMGAGGQLDEHSPVPWKAILADWSFEADAIELSQEELTWVIVGVESLSQGSTFANILPFVENRKVGITVDESTRIKNHDKIRTQRTITLGRAAPIKLISTGAPVTKNMLDFYSQFDFLDPNIIGVGDYYAFRNRYAIMGGFKRKEIIGYDHVEELMGLIEPYTYRCDKPKGLPAQLWTHREVELTDVQKEAYRKMKKGEMPGVTVKNILSRMLRLQQIVGGFYSDDPKYEQNQLTGRTKKVKGTEHRLVEAKDNPKIKEILAIAEEADRPIIVWAKFVFEIDDLMTILTKEGRVARFTGEESNADRIAIRQGFQRGDFDFLVGNQMVGGIGHTFTRAHLMVYYSNTQSLDDRLQSEDRIHRLGQDEDCLYIDLIAKRTVDVPIQMSIAEKKELDLYIREKLDEAAAGKETVIDLLLGAP